MRWITAISSAAAAACLTLSGGRVLAWFRNLLTAARISRDLRESALQLELAADAANLGIWIRDLVRNEVRASERWRTIFGFEKSEPLDFDQVLARVHPSDREIFREASARAIAVRGRYETEYRIIRPDGGIRWIASRGRVESNSRHNPVLIRGVSLDVTDRKRAEERLRMVVEASSSALLMLNPESGITLVNAKAESIFGYRREELIGLHFEILIPDDFRENHRGYHREYSAVPITRAMGAGRELSGRRKDGSLVPIEIGLNPVQTPDGLYVVASIVDITERRQSEQEIRDLRQTLTHTGRVSMLGQLASSLAHELGQPLGAILRNAETAELLLQSDSPDLEELRAIVNDIRKDDLRAGDVIDRLRSLLKRRSLQSASLGLGDLMADVIMLVRGDALARRVHLAADIPADLPRVLGDRVHLQQVLLNLIMNGMDAVDAEPEQNRSVKLHARLNEDGMVELGVSDRGHGVAPETLARLFDTFFTTKPNGMGMGLPIAKTIVEAHGGRIWAESSLGRGTTLRFTLRCAATGAEA